MNILLLADTTHPTAAVSDHIKAITKDSVHQWFVVNPLYSRALHKVDFEAFDAVGFHYSIRPHHKYYTSKQLYNKVKKYRGRKFQFLQDEYSQVQQTMDAMADLGISLVYTLLKQELVKQAYPDPRLSETKFVTVLTGYIPDDLQETEVPPISERKTDIFYRSRICPYWLGKIAQDKINIAEGISERTRGMSLTVDVSVLEEDRIYGQEWVNRLSNTKTVLGTESGASIWDFTGEIEEKTRKYLQKNPNATFEDAEKELLAPYESNLLYTAISPRVFEAAALKTPMIMFEGWYSGVCTPHEHYIVLEKDFSNLAEVLEKLKDNDYLQALADRTYEDLIASGRYAESMLAKAVDETITPVESHAVSNMYTCRQSHIDTTLRNTRLIHYYYLITSELTFATQNFFRILFDSSVPLNAKAKKLYLGGQRYFLYLKPRLLRAFSDDS